MATAIHLTHAIEVCVCDKGITTSSFAEVLHGEVQDWGGNILFSGTPDECVTKKWLTPTKLVATHWRAVDGEVGGSDHQWPAFFGARP